MHDTGQPNEDRVVRWVEAVFRELRVFLLAFFPIKNVEYVDFHVDERDKIGLSSVISYMGLVLFAGIFLLAYGLHADQQTLTPQELIGNLLPKDTAPAALLNSFFKAVAYNVAFMGLAFLGFGLVLGVSMHWLIRTIRLAVYNAVAVLVYLWAVGYVFDLPPGVEQLIGLPVVGILFVVETFSVVVIYVMLIKRRMGADGYQQPLMPMIEAALGARALCIALQGNATLVNVPLPHWMVAYGPSLIVIIGFCAQAAWVQRKHINLLIEQGDEWAALSHRQRSQVGREAFNLRLQRQHWLRFGACILLMFVGAVVFSMYKSRPLPMAHRIAVGHVIYALRDVFIILS